MLDNLLTSAHVIHQAYHHGVRRLLYLTSSCIYPHCQATDAPESLLTGPLEPTNEAYAVAKISGWKLCEAYRQEYGVEFRVAILANALVPATISAMRTATLSRDSCGACTRRRRAPTSLRSGARANRCEFGYAPDLAAACVNVVKHDDCPEPINIGGQVLSIADVTALIADVVGYKGRLRHDPRLSDGMPRKTLDCHPCSKRDYRPKTDFRTALEKTYAWFVENFRPEATDDRVVVSALLRIRRLEEEVARVYPSDQIKSPVHLSIGQEAVSVGVCDSPAARRRRLRHLPRPRPLPGQGRRPEAHGRRAVRQGDRLHAGQGRLDAPDRHRVRRHGHVRRRRHHHRQRRRATPTPCKHRGSRTPWSSASSATAPPRRAFSPRA